jgi:hypothetical protein
MFTGRAIAKYVAAIAIGSSAGGVLGYEVHRLTPRDHLPVVRVQPGKFAPAVESRISVWFRPIVEALP